MKQIYPKYSRPAKTFFSGKTFKTFFAFVVCILLLVKESNATHMRFGNISWTWVSGNTVNFHVSQSWRRSYFVPSPNVGSTENTSTIAFGDGQTASVVITVTAINTTSDWFFGETTITHTYASGGTYTASVGECCRLNTLQNNANQPDQVLTVVNLNGSNSSSPVSTLQPIVDIPTGVSNVSFQIPAFHPNGLSFNYTLTTPIEMGGTSLTQPPGFSVNSETGVVTWSTVGRAVDQLWNASITITDASGSTTTDDFIMEIVANDNPPYFVYSVTPANATTYIIPPGQSLTFNVEAADNTSNDLVTLQALDLPVGAKMTSALPTSGNPVQSSFTWTPTASQLGASVIEFLAQDENGVQVSSTVNVIVSYNPIFDSPPTPTDSSTFCLPAGTPYSAVIQFSSPDPGMPLSISYANIPVDASLSLTIPTSPSDTARTVLSWTPQVSDWGPHWFTFTATDTLGRTSTSTFEIVVNNQPFFSSTPPVNLTITPNQPFVYNISIDDTDVQYGDAIEIMGIGLPSWLTVEETGTLGQAVLSGVPGSANIGSYPIQIQASDSFDHCYGPISQYFTINVVPCNFSVQLSPVVSGPYCPGQSVRLMATAGTSYSWSNGDTSQTITEIAGSSTVYSVTVFSGYCASTATYTLASFDTTSPVAIAKNITVAIVGSSVLITPADIDGGSSDNCGIASRTLSQSAFNCSNLGPNTVTLTVTDGSGNSASATAIVTVIDNTPPVAVCQNISITLAQGSASITAADVDGGSTDNCGIASETISQSTFTCANVGQNNVLLTVTDASGNSSSCTAVVTVIDNTPPVAICQNINVDLTGSTANIQASDIDGGSTAECGIATRSVSPSSFTCANLGPNNVTFTVTDASGNSASCAAVVTVIDNTPPLTICQDYEVYLNNGSATITAADVDGGSTDNCGIASLTISPSSFGVANLGANLVTLSATDASGNSSSCNAIVTVIDTTSPSLSALNISIPLFNGFASINADQVLSGIDDPAGIAYTSVQPDTFTCSNLGPNQVLVTVTDSAGNTSTTNAIVTLIDTTPPVTICQNYQVYLNNGIASITAGDIDGGSTDACGIASLTVSTSTFGIANIGENQVILTATDAAGNSSSCTATVTVLDTTPPNLTASNITIQLSGSSATIQADQVLSGITDHAGIAYSSVVPDSFNCSNLGNNQVLVTVTDSAGNTSTINAIVTLVDNTPPVAVCKNITIPLIGNSASISAADVDGGSTDNCGIVSRSVTPSIFDRSNLGFNSVTLTVTDASGNSSSCNAIVTVVDNTPPVAVCQNITLPLTGSSANITASDIDGGSTDNCSIAYMTITPSFFDCTNLGPNQVTLTVTDESGNTDSCIATVNIIDTAAPVAICKNITLPLLNGSATITAADLDGGSYDNCGIASETISQSTFACENLGLNSVTLTVTDASGNSSACTAEVTIVNITAPVAVCKNITIPLVVNSATITAADVDGGSTGDCGIASRTISQSEFTCADLGENTVVLTVADASGNSSSCNAIVTVVDNAPPLAVCKNITVPLIGGSASITASQVDGGGTDNCGIASMSVSPSTFDCSNLGENTVTLTVTDISGNTSSCQAIVTIRDNTPPIAICQNIIVPLIGSSATITAAQVDGGSTDNCSIASRSVSPSSFTCANLGPNTVTLTVTDGSGNTSSCQAIVTIIDNTPPVAICRSLQLTLTGSSVTITADSINNGSYDNCGIASKTISQSTFTSSDIGSNSVTLTVTDASGNSSSCDAIVTIIGNTPDNVVCRNFTVALSGSTATITAADLDGGSTAPSGIASRSISKSTFNCSNVGANNVTFSILDSTDSTYSCNAIVTVVDNTPPVVVCKNITVPLAGSSATITAAQIDGGSSDNCSIASRTISQSTFDCANLGANQVTLTVTDPSGNSSSCAATVTVVDNTPPVVICKNITLLMLQSSISIIPAQIDNGSTDNCTIVSRTLSQSTFTCANMGPNNVTLTETDEAGNSSSCTAVVTIEDDALPLAIGKNITVDLGSNGTVTITGAEVDGGSTPVCGIATRTVHPSTFTCSNIGANAVTLTVSDYYGNTSTTTATVTVVDNTSPVAVCKNITVPLAGASAIITASQVDGGSTDNCGIVSRTISTSSFTCANLGANNVTLTLKDASGNTSSCTAIVTVVDNTPPTAICKNISVTLVNGLATITASELNNGSYDNCSIASLSISQSTFTCSNVGSNYVTLTVKDEAGNSSSCTSIVTVIDNTPPTAKCKNITVPLVGGSASITAAQVDGGSTDECGITSRTISQSTFTCANLGPNHVTLTVKDASGNSASCTAIVTIIDNTPPVAVCKNITVALVNGEASITASELDGGSTDNCSIASRTVLPSTFTCSNIGQNTVVFTVTDGSGNSSSCDATVTVTGSMPSCSIKPSCNSGNVIGNLLSGQSPNTIYLGYSNQSCYLTASGNCWGTCTYEWSQASGLSSTNCASPLYSPTAAGNCTFDVTVTNSSGCSSTGSCNISVTDCRYQDNNGNQNGNGGNQGGNSNSNDVCLCHYQNGSWENLTLEPSQVSLYMPCYQQDYLGLCSQNSEKSSNGSSGKFSNNGNTGANNNGNNTGKSASAYSAPAAPGSGSLNPNDFDMQLYPNPYSQQFNVHIETGSTENMDIKMYNVEGKVIWERPDADPATDIVMGAGIASGVYFVEVKQGDKVKTLRVVKTE